MRDAALGGDVAQTGPRVHLAERERTPLPKGDVGGRRKRVPGCRRRKRRGRRREPRPAWKRCRRFGSAKRHWRRRRRRRPTERWRRRRSGTVLLKERDARNIGTRADMKRRERRREGWRWWQGRTGESGKEGGWRRRDVAQIDRTRWDGAGRSGGQIAGKDVEFGQRQGRREIDRTRQGGAGRSGDQFGREDVKGE